MSKIRLAGEQISCVIYLNITQIVQDISIYGWRYLNKSACLTFRAVLVYIGVAFLSLKDYPEKFVGCNMVNTRVFLYKEVYLEWRKAK
ncbi:hypothetical protein D3Z36_02200 [Lachnospiraceae bacterium]|nr:hypothetical protein [Lachnospiraceae bacterium]